MKYCTASLYSLIYTFDFILEPGILGSGFDTQNVPNTSCLGSILDKQHAETRRLCMETLFLLIS